MTEQKERRKRDYGSGGLYYSESRGYWIGQYKLGVKPDGKPDVKTVYGKTKAEAQKKLRAVKDEASRMEYVYVQKSTLDTFLLYWLENIKKIELKPKSYDRLEDTLKKDIIPYIGKIQLGAVETSDIQGLIKRHFDAGRAHSSIKKVYDAMNAAYKWGLSVKPPKVKMNPCDGVVLPSKKMFKPSEIKFYTEEEAELITKAALDKYPCGTPHYPLGGAIVLVLNTGIRLAELLGLEWARDIDLENNILTVHHTVVTVKDRSEDAKRKFIVKEQDSTKTDSGQDREIPLNDMARQALASLQKYTGKSKYVMATRNGNRKSARDVDKLVRRIIIRAGFPEEKVYGLHALRHTFATLLIQRKIDIKTISELTCVPGRSRALGRSWPSASTLPLATTRWRSSIRSRTSSWRSPASARPGIRGSATPTWPTAEPVMWWHSCRLTV